MSFRSAHSPSIYIKPYSKPAATPTKRRDSKLWSQTVTHNTNEGLTKVEIKRQEAIFELYQGEVELVEDLQLILKTYRDSMKSLRILNQQELATIFFRLEELIPLHEELIERLERLRQEDGRTDSIGKDIAEWLLLDIFPWRLSKVVTGKLSRAGSSRLLGNFPESFSGEKQIRITDRKDYCKNALIKEWLPELTDCYSSYCVNQLAAKSLLDEKKQEKRVQDFLERCQESPFSRKLDLWNFLDVPRSRLVKYPLLLKNILRLTPVEHEDKSYLTNANGKKGVVDSFDIALAVVVVGRHRLYLRVNLGIKRCDEIIKEVDKSTGEHKCQFYINQLEYLDENQRHPLIAEQKSLHCMGMLRNNKGQKLHVFLFEDILVVTRIATRNGVKGYQLTRSPIPVQSLNLEDVPEGELRTGSFRGAFSSNQTG
ncbi:putative rho guanine nucleotide exchange factor 3 isoform X2 [Apostichopus japonicus]|uniref:Putative rho guanine nucleotide exchange factor 3 isoform X2 n=1 Tax=Stichopus japonicus TaxID=307972 RepID=A0A2G8KC52_STIJA|nr:putative rho guanine nucleotide exchange factor 3 isoform X2 [Apostichopus japonicus]